MNVHNQASSWATEHKQAMQNKMKQQSIQLQYIDNDTWPKQNITQVKHANP